MSWAFTPAAYPLSIPRNLGTITHTSQSSERTVICLQDLHCNYEVQKNIVNIIHALARDYGVKLVAMEGASGSLNVTKLSDFPLEGIKRQTADYLMRQGKITGPEFYAAVGKYPVRLEGIEDPALYSENRTTAAKFLNDENQGTILDLREALQEIKKRIYSPALLRLDAEKASYRSGKISLLPYALFLFRQAQARRVDLEAYPHFQAYVADAAERPAENVDAELLLGELETLERSLRTGLYRNPAQKELDDLDSGLDLMEKLLCISATPEDLAEFCSGPEKFSVKKYTDFIQRHDPQKSTAWEQELGSLDQALQQVVRFYQVADQRSEAFVHNVLQRMNQYHASAALLITGGYHTPDIMAALERQGVSCLCVKPSMTQQDTVNPYFSLLRNRRTPLEKMILKNQKTLALQPASPETKPDLSQVRLHPDDLSAEQRMYYTQVEMYHKLGIVAAWAQGAKDRTAAALRAYYHQIRKAEDWDDRLVTPDLDSRQDFAGGFDVQFENLEIAAVFQEPQTFAASISRALADLTLGRFTVALIPKQQLRQVRRALEKAKPAWSISDMSLRLQEVFKQAAGRIKQRFEVNMVLRSPLAGVLLMVLPAGTHSGLSESERVSSRGRIATRIAELHRLAEQAPPYTYQSRLEEQVLEYHRIIVPAELQALREDLAALAQGRPGAFERIRTDLFNLSAISSLEAVTHFGRNQFEHIAKVGQVIQHLENWRQPSGSIRELIRYFQEDLKLTDLNEDNLRRILAAYSGLDPEERQVVVLAGLLHDYGKLIAGDLVGLEGVMGTRSVEDLLLRLEQAQVITSRQKRLLAILINRHMDINTMHFLESNGVTEKELDESLGSDPELKAAYFRLMPLLFFFDVAGYTRPVLKVQDLKNVDSLFDPQKFYRLINALGRARLSLGFYGQGFNVLNFDACLDLPASDAIPADSTLKQLPEPEQDFLQGQFLPRLFIQGHGMMLVRQIYSLSPASADKLIYLMSCLHQATGITSLTYRFTGDLTMVARKIHEHLQALSLEDIKERFASQGSLQDLFQDQGLNIFTDRRFQAAVIQITEAGSPQPAAPEKQASRFSPGHLRFSNIMGPGLRLPWLLQYYIYGLFNKAVKADLQALHPRWKEFAALLEKLHKQYGRTEAGYFNYERGLHTAWLAQLYGNDAKLAPGELKELAAAALLERFNLQLPYTPLDLQGTIHLLDNGVGLAAALQAAEVDAARIKLLIQGSAYPWETEQEQAWELALSSLDKGEAASLRKQAEILRLANQAVTYLIHDPRMALDRVRELHRDKPSLLNPEQMFLETRNFLERLQPEMERRHRLSGLPAWMQRNWRDNRAYFDQDFREAQTAPRGLLAAPGPAVYSWQERLGLAIAARTLWLKRLINLAPWPAMLGILDLIPLRPHVPAALLAKLPILLRPWLQDSRSSVQYWAYQLFYNAMKSTFRGLHPEWDQYALALANLRGLSGREWSGYHRFEHGLEVAFMAWIYGREKSFDQEQMLHVVVAASLHDLDLRPEYKSPKVANTLNFLDPVQWDNMQLDPATREKLQTIIAALAAMQIDLQVVRTLIRRTDFPWGDAAQKAYAQDLALVPQPKQAWTAEAAEALQFMDKASGYICLDNHSGYERVLELHREIDQVLPSKEFRANEPKIMATTVGFLDVLQKPGTPDRAILDRLPAWAARQWRSTFDYFASLVVPAGIPDLFATLHPKWQEYVNFLASVKGKSGREGGGYFSYEHGLWAGYMMWLLGKSAYSGQKMTECIVAASLQRFDLREAYAKPDLARTVAFIRSDEKLKAVLEAMAIDPKVIAMIVAGTAYPWDQARAGAWEAELIREIPSEGQRAQIRHQAGLLRFINVTVTYTVNTPAQAAKEVYELHRVDEKAHWGWVKTFVSAHSAAGKASPAQMAESTMRFMEWVEADPDFTKRMQDLPAWMLKRWRDNHAYFQLEFQKHLFRVQGLRAGLLFSLRLALENKFDQAFGYASLPAKMLNDACLRAFGPTWGPRVSVVVVRSALETLAFPLVAAFFGLPLWATIGFAFAHTIVEWYVRAKAGGAAAVFNPQALAQDFKDFVLRVLGGGLFLLPFIHYAHALAFAVSFSGHAVYNAWALYYNEKLLPGWARILGRRRKSPEFWQHWLRLPVMDVFSRGEQDVINAAEDLMRKSHQIVTADVFRAKVEAEEIMPGANIIIITTDKPEMSVIFSHFDGEGNRAFLCGFDNQGGNFSIPTRQIGLIQLRHLNVALPLDYSVPAKAQAKYLAEMASAYNLMGIGPGSQVVSVGTGEEYLEKMICGFPPLLIENDFELRAAQAGATVRIFEPRTEVSDKYQLLTDDGTFGSIHVMPAQQADFRKADLRDQDMVVMKSILSELQYVNEINDRQQLADKAVRVLKKGGWLVLGYYAKAAVAAGEVIRIHAKILDTESGKVNDVTIKDPELGEWSEKETTEQRLNSLRGQGYRLDLKFELREPDSPMAHVIQGYQVFPPEEKAREAKKSKAIPLPGQVEPEAQIYTSKDPIALPGKVEMRPLAPLMSILPPDKVQVWCTDTFGPVWGLRAAAAYLFVIGPAWETAAFPLVGLMLGGLGGMLWATIGFAAAHTIVEWYVRAKEGGAAAVFNPQALAQDVKDFIIRAGLGWLFLSPFSSYASYLMASLVSFGYHGAYNALALAYNRFLRPQAVRIFSRAGMFSQAAWERLLTAPMAAIGAESIATDAQNEKDLHLKTQQLLNTYFPDGYASMIPVNNEILTLIREIEDLEKRLGYKSESVRQVLPGTEAVSGQVILPYVRPLAGVNYVSLPDGWKALEEKIRVLGQSQKRVTLGIGGREAGGKTQLAGQIKRRGIAGLAPEQILLIDVDDLLGEDKAIKIARLNQDLAKGGIKLVVMAEAGVGRDWENRIREWKVNLGEVDIRLFKDAPDPVRWHRLARRMETNRESPDPSIVQTVRNMVDRYGAQAQKALRADIVIFDADEKVEAQEQAMIGAEADRSGWKARTKDKAANPAQGAAKKAEIRFLELTNDEDAIAGKITRMVLPDQPYTAAGIARELGIPEAQAAKVLRVLAEHGELDEPLDRTYTSRPIIESKMTRVWDVKNQKSTEMRMVCVSRKDPETMESVRKALNSAIDKIIKEIIGGSSNRHVLQGFEKDQDYAWERDGERRVPIGKEYLLAALQQNHLLGSLSVSLQEQNRLYLHYIEVQGGLKSKKKYRGVGDELVKTAIRFALATGCITRNPDILQAAGEQSQQPGEFSKKSVIYAKVETNAGENHLRQLGVGHFNGNREDKSLYFYMTPKDALQVYLIQTLRTQGSMSAEELWRTDNLSLGYTLEQVERILAELTQAHKISKTQEKKYRFLEAHERSVGAGDSSQAAIRHYIENRLNQAETKHTADLVRDFWRTALADPRNPVLSSLESLGRAGVKSKTLENLVDVLMALGVNVTNPWTAMYHLSDIVGYLSPDLLGEDISRFKELCRTNEFRDVSIIENNNSVQVPEDLSDLTWPELLAIDREIKEEQEKLILSNRPFDRIAQEVAGSSNELVKKLIKTFIERIWHDLGVPGNSRALIFFRDCKTFASDLDMYYWGPEAEKVNLELTKLFFLLGFKRDLFSTFLLDREIEEGRIDFYAYAYFSTVECVAFNGASPAEFYQQEIKAKLDADKVWQEIHPYLCRQLAKWNGMSIEDDLPVTLDDIKKLQHRAIINLIFGLCCKFKTDFGLDNPSVFLALQKFMPPAEVQILARALDMANHARNLNQIVTRRRWEKIDPRTRNKIAEIMASQGLPGFTQKVRDMGRELEALRLKYFSLPDYRSTVYMPLKSDARAVEAWRRVASAYLQICKQNISQTSETAKDPPAQILTTQFPAREQEEAAAAMRKDSEPGLRKGWKILWQLLTFKSVHLAVRSGQNTPEAGFTFRHLKQQLKMNLVVAGANLSVVDASGRQKDMVLESWSEDFKTLHGYDENGNPLDIHSADIRHVNVLNTNRLFSDSMLSAPISAAAQAGYIRQMSALYKILNLVRGKRLVSVGPGVEYWNKNEAGVPAMVLAKELEFAAAQAGAEVVVYEPGEEARPKWRQLILNWPAGLGKFILRAGQRADFTRPDLPDQSAEAVVLKSVLSDFRIDIHAKEAMVENAARILKDKGFLILGTYREAHLANPKIRSQVEKLSGPALDPKTLARSEQEQTEVYLDDLRKKGWQLELVAAIAEPGDFASHDLLVYQVTRPAGKANLKVEARISSHLQPERPYTSRQISEGVQLSLQDVRGALEKMVAAGDLEEPIADIYACRPIIRPKATEVFSTEESKKIIIRIEQVTRIRGEVFALVQRQLKRNLLAFREIMNGKDYSEIDQEKTYLLVALKGEQILASLSMKLPRLGKKAGPSGIRLHLLEENERGITEKHKGIGNELFKDCIRFAISLGYVTRDQNIQKKIFGSGQMEPRDWFSGQVVMHSYAISKKGANFAKNAQVGTLTKDPEGYLVWRLTPKDLLKYYLRQTLRTSGPLNAGALWQTDNLQVAYTQNQVNIALAELAREDKVRSNDAGEYFFVPNHVLTNPLRNRTLMNAVMSFIMTVIAAGLSLRLLIPGYQAQSEWGVQAAGQAGIFSGLQVSDAWGIVNWLGLHPVLVVAAMLLGVLILTYFLRDRTNRFGLSPLAAILLLLAIPNQALPGPVRMKAKKGYTFEDFSGYAAYGTIASGANIEILPDKGEALPLIFERIDAKSGWLRGFTLDGKPYARKGKNIRLIRVLSTNTLTGTGYLSRVLTAEEQVRHHQDLNALLRIIGVKAGQRVTSVGPGDEYREKIKAGIPAFLMQLHFETFWARLGAKVSIFETGAERAAWQDRADRDRKHKDDFEVKPQDQADFSRNLLAPRSQRAVVMKSVLSDERIPGPVRESMVLNAAQGLEPGGFLIIGCYNTAHFANPAILGKLQDPELLKYASPGELQIIAATPPQEKYQREFLEAEKYVNLLRKQGYRLKLVKEVSEPGDYISHDLYVYQVQPPEKNEAAQALKNATEEKAAPEFLLAGGPGAINQHPYIQALILRHGLENPADLMRLTAEQAVSRISLQAPTGSEAGWWESIRGGIWGSAQIEADESGAGRLNIYLPATVTHSLALPEGYASLQDTVKFNEHLFLRNSRLDRLPWLRGLLMLFSGSLLYVVSRLGGRTKIINPGWAAWLAEKQLILMIEHQTGKAYRQSRRAAWRAVNGLDRAGAALWYGEGDTRRALTQGQTLADYLDADEEQVAVGPHEFVGLFAEWLREFQELTGQTPDMSVMNPEAIRAKLGLGDKQAAEPYWSAKAGFESLRHIAASMPENLLGIFAGEFQGQAGESIAQQGLQALLIKGLGVQAAKSALAAKRQPAEPEKHKQLTSLACPETAKRMQAEVEKALAILSQATYDQRSQGLQARLNVLRQALIALQTADAGQPVTLDETVSRIMAAELAIQHQGEGAQAVNTGKDFGENVFVLSAPAVEIQKLKIGDKTINFALPQLAEAVSGNQDVSLVLQEAMQGRLLTSTFRGQQSLHGQSGPENLNFFHRTVLSAAALLPASAAGLLHQQVMFQQPRAYIENLKKAAQSWGTVETLPLARELFRANSPLQLKYWQWAQINPDRRREWNQAQGEFIRSMIRYMNKYAQAYPGTAGNLANLKFFSFCLQQMKAVATDDTLVVSEARDAANPSTGNTMTVPILLLGKGYRSQLGALADLLRPWGLELDPQVKGKYFRKSFSLSFGGAA